MAVRKTFCGDAFTHQQTIGAVRNSASCRSTILPPLQPFFCSISSSCIPRPQFRTVCGPAVALYFKLKEAMHATKVRLTFIFSLVYIPRRDLKASATHCVARPAPVVHRDAQRIRYTHTGLRANSLHSRGPYAKFDEMRGGELVKLAHTNASYRFPLSLHFVFADAPNQAYLLPTPFAAVLSAGHLLGFLVHRPSRAFTSPQTRPAASSFSGFQLRRISRQRHPPAPSWRTLPFRFATTSSSATTPLDPRAPATSSDPFRSSLPESKQLRPPCHSLAPNAAAAYAISLVACGLLRLPTAPASSSGTTGRVAPSPFDEGFRVVGCDILHRSRVQASRQRETQINREESAHSIIRSVSLSLAPSSLPTIVAAIVLCTAAPYRPSPSPSRRPAFLRDVFLLRSLVGNAMMTSLLVVLPYANPSESRVRVLLGGAGAPRLDCRRVDHIDIIAQEVAATLDGAFYAHSLAGARCADEVCVVCTFGLSPIPQRELTHFLELRLSDFVSRNNNSEAQLRAVRSTVTSHSPSAQTFCSSTLVFWGFPNLKLPGDVNDNAGLVGCKVHAPVHHRVSRDERNEFRSTQPSSQLIFELSSNQVFQMTSGIVANG
ncbi:hypothetical protein C8R44DRAFT_896283 [Mycena epipterygia]|nr:hypothetical protein C8R44DRAFT_896283 [Mycena epipterygia]